MNNGNGDHDPEGSGVYELDDPVPPRPPLAGNVVVRATADEVVDSLAADLAIHAENCVREFGDFHLALSGGETFDLLYRRLMYDPMYRRIPWRRTHLWLVHETCVPFDDEASTYRAVHDTIGDHADIPPEQFHIIRSEQASADRDYETELRESLGWRERGQDRLDYALLTMDEQGGTAGFAAGAVTAAGFGDGALVRRVPGPTRGHPDRVTMTLSFLNAARFIAVMVTGAPRAPALHRLARRRAGVDDMPITGVAPMNGELKWYLDAGSASAPDED